MEFKYCKLTPCSPLHLGEREFWREGSSVFIHSDTLFSGICHCYGLLYGQDDLKQFVKQVKDEQVLKVSSAFPFWEGDWYFPVPKNQIPESKEAYKIQFIEHSGFEQLMAGKKLEELLNDQIKVIPRKEKPYTPWELVNVPRISLNRLSSHPLEEGGYFHSGRVTYRNSAGFFFLYQTTYEETEHRFQATMRLLADEGIGGDRSCGNGLMEQPEFGTLNLNFPDSANYELTLSLYFPADQDHEIKNLSDGFFDLLERKGYIYSPYGQSLRRCSVRMFVEGSVFPATQNRIGSLEDVTPAAFPEEKHHIFRYGLFFGVPCREEVSQA